MIRLMAGIFLGVLGLFYFVFCERDEYGVPRDPWDVAFLRLMGVLMGYLAGCLLAGV